MGEIGLVVIGILIALQVNNWNNQKQNENKISNYFNEIQTNLQIDISLIDSIISYNDRKVEQLIKTIDFYYKIEHDDIYRDSIYLIAYYGNIASFMTFKSNKNGFNALINSGELNLIPDSIRIQLNNYYDRSLEESENSERSKSLTRGTVQDKIIRSIVTKDFIELFTGLKISPANSKDDKFIARNDVAMDLVFLSEIERGRNKQLKELRKKGEALYKVLDSQVKK